MRQRWEEPDDLIQVPLFYGVLIGGLSLDLLQPLGEVRMGFLKEKKWGV